MLHQRRLIVLKDFPCFTLIKACVGTEGTLHKITIHQQTAAVKPIPQKPLPIIGPWLPQSNRMQILFLLPKCQKAESSAPILDWKWFLDGWFDRLAIHQSHIAYHFDGHLPAWTSVRVWSLVWVSSITGILSFFQHLSAVRSRELD